ncbi:MAG: transposase [Actinomycetia bacterium]|nr:transposase [Actinomycetes bacterium]
MARSYRPVDRDQQFLLPPDMSQWLGADHFVWFLIDVIDEFDMSVFEAGSRRGGVGRAAYDPRMLLGLLVYGYASGQRSARRIEDLCRSDVAFRILCAQDAPDHTTIARFRQRHEQAVSELFVQVLELAGQAGMGRVGVVAIDGTKIAANASGSANRRRSWLASQVEQMMAEAEQTDAAEDAMFGDESGDRPTEPGWTDPTSRKERIKAALARTDAAEAAEAAGDDDRVARWAERIDKARANVERERARAKRGYDAYHAKKAKAARDGTTGPRGHCPDTPDDYAIVKIARDRLARVQNRHRRAAEHAAENAGDRDPRANITDPDSGPMPIAGGFLQGYNAQLAVADDQIILAASVTTDTVDTGHYLPMTAAAQDGAQALNRGRQRSPNEAVKTKQDTIGTIVADAGYLSIENLTADGPDRLIATRRRHKLEADAKHAQDPAADEHDDPTEPDDPREKMSRRLRTPEAMAIYRRRGVIVEPVNGHLKDRTGLRRFSRRGRPAVQAELDLAAATTNLLKIWRHRHRTTKTK